MTSPCEIFAVILRQLIVDNHKGVDQLPFLLSCDLLLGYESLKEPRGTGKVLENKVCVLFEFQIDFLP